MLRLRAADPVWKAIAGIDLAWVKDKVLAILHGRADTVATHTLVYANADLSEANRPARCSPSPTTGRTPPAGTPRCMISDSKVTTQPRLADSRTGASPSSPCPPRE